MARSFIRPSTAWLFLFVPALLYYVGTRLRSVGLFRSSTYGRPVTAHLTWTPPLEGGACQAKGGSRDLLFLRGDCHALAYPVYVVQEDLGAVVATTWREDEDLGRGYLLASTSAGRGKIFRWETGGGPIAIGRTLSLKDSGCRSGAYRSCPISNGTDAGSTQHGSGGIVVDTTHAPPRLIVAEFGEGRVSRLEENGARTPLVIEVPTGTDGTSKRPVGGQDDSANDGHERLANPTKLLMSPYGDLLILDSRAAAEGLETGGGSVNDILWRLPKAADIPALPSLAASREAHFWRSLNSTELPHSFFQSGAIGGMVLDPSGQRLYVTTQQGPATVVVSLPLLEDIDSDDPEETDSEAAQGATADAESRVTEGHPENDKNEAVHRELNQARHQVLLDYSDFASAPGAIEIDNIGNLYLVVEGGVLIVSQSLDEKVKISFSIAPQEKLVDLTLGSDKFLYIASESKLARVQIPNKPLEVPTDFLIKA